MLLFSEDRVINQSSSLSSSNNWSMSCINCLKLEKIISLFSHYSMLFYLKCMFSNCLAKIVAKFLHGSHRNTIHEKLAHMKIGNFLGLEGLKNIFIMLEKFHLNFLIIQIFKSKSKTH